MGVARAALWLFALVALSAALLTLQPRSAAFAHATIVAHEPAGLPAAHCSGSSYHPDPTPVEVTGVPIVVESTTDEYFVLYVKHDLGVSRPPADVHREPVHTESNTRGWRDNSALHT